MTGSTDPDDLGGADLGRLLTDLADDPDAPPTSVSALSVIAAARAGARPAEPAATAAEPTVPAGAEPAGAEPAGGSTAAGSAPPTVGELHVLTARQDADRRAKRRRTVLIGGLAAACAVAVAAIVIPLAVSKSASTTSAGASPDTSQAGAPAQASQAGGAAAAAPSAESSAQAGLAATDQSQAGGTAAPTVNPSNPDANRPPPGESALTQTVPVPGGTAPTTAAGGGVAPGGVPEASCWPALSDAASAALVAALPQGAFGPPGPLGLGCPADPVAGASLTGTAAPDAQLVVRVTHAEPGACAQSASETGAKCVARGGDQYVSNDSGNLSVYAYGNGYEVQVGGRPATGIAPIPSGLSADQLSTAAAAVLASLG